MEAEQVFEVLLRVVALPVKFTVKGCAGNRPVHDVVGALVADGEAPSAAFVLLPQAALDHDGSSGIVEENNIVSINEPFGLKDAYRVLQKERDTLLAQKEIYEKICAAALPRWPKDIEVGE